MLQSLTLDRPGARSRFAAAQPAARVFMSAVDSGGRAENPQPGDMTALILSVARRQDRKAFAQIFGHYAPRVKSYLMRHGADDGQAEEVVQETMLAVWRKAALFDASKASAGTWIFTIARNLRIDAIRRSRRPEFDAEDPAFVPDPESAPDEALQADRMRLKVREALKDLPEEQASVVKLSFFEDKPHGEIAKELSLPLGTVKSRLRLAMRRIRTALGEKDE